MEAFEQEHPIAEKGAVNLHNNPDVPSDRPESLQDELPDTNPMMLPINTSTNLPN